MTPEKTILNINDNNIYYTEGDINLLNTIHKYIKTNKVEEVTTNILNKNKTNNTIHFYINKQAAYHNKFHIIDENMSALDDIEIIIETENPDDIIKWIIS